jgi:hypothetical protein
LLTKFGEDWIKEWRRLRGKCERSGSIKKTENSQLVTKRMDDEKNYQKCD